MKHCDVAIIGSGPYGLSVTAHLRARAIDTALFGEPMSFWDKQMPQGMMLRSPSVACQLSDPANKFTLQAYCDKSKKEPSTPVPLTDFVEYGLWFKRQVAPDGDTRNVAKIEKNGNFRLTLEDGEQVHATRVVVAAGIASFPERPAKFAGFPDVLVSHSSEHRDFAHFKGRQIAIIGAGQSALESAALLHEAGAEVEVLVRSSNLRWLQPKKQLHSFTPLERMLYAPSDIGPPGVSQLVARPNYYRMLPRSLQDRLAVRSIRPAGAVWLRPRVENVRISTTRSVESVRRVKDQLEITLNDGSQRVVDHLLLATGYRVDISRYEFLPPHLLAAIKTANGYPRLNSGFECSTPGLHFVGAPAAWSFGPLMRFVAGTEFTACAVARGIANGQSNFGRY